MVAREVVCDNAWSEASRWVQAAASEVDAGEFGDEERKADSCRWGELVSVATITSHKELLRATSSRKRELTDRRNKSSLVLLRRQHKYGEDKLRC